MPPDLVDRYLAEGWWTDDTLGSMVAGSVGRRAGAELAIHSKVRPWRGTFGDVDRAARKFAAGLRAVGVEPGDVVLFQLPNWVEAAITFWGAAQLGAIVVPVVHFYGPKEVGYVLDVVRPKAVITAARFGATDFLANYEGLLADHPHTPWFVVGDEGEALPARARPFGALLDAEPIAGPVAVDPAGPAVIGFTSGTTRDPKGVVHSHRTLGFEIRQLGAMAGVDVPTLTAAPVGHFIGMLNALLIPLLKNHEIHLIDQWDPAEVLRVMREEGIAMGGGAPYFFTSLLDHPDFTDAHLAHMPIAGMGGSSIPLAVTERLDGLGIKVYRSYGSTEHPSITGCSIHDPVDKRLATDGRELPGVEMRLDDEGEISSRGPDLFLGYTDPELTARVFDDEGWYRTGDIGVRDADGYLMITDRISDIIIRGGENISAQEVEEQLLGLHGVAEVAVVSAPDDRLGEHAAAIVRLLPDTARPTLDDVRTHLAAVGLAKQKWPEEIHVVSDLPRTASGKVQKFKLRQQLRDGRLDLEVS